MKNTLTAVLLSSVCVMAFAQTDEAAFARCKTYHYKLGDIFKVEAQLYKQTHIRLPEEALDVVWGAKDMWETDWIQNNLFIKPLTHLPQGQENTITVIGKSGNTYQFLVVRRPRVLSHCVILKSDGTLVNRDNWLSHEQKQEKQLLAMQAQVSAAQEQARRTKVDAERQAKDAVRKYQLQMHTGYDWSKASGWFAEGGVIDSVWDDGRFTYIRLKRDNKGVMGVVADIDGKQEMLEYKYDAPARVYKVHGIFPKFTMRSGSSELVITRGADRG